MNELIDKLLKAKLQAKIGLTVALMVVVGLFYNFMFLADLEDEIKVQTAQHEQLVTEKASYEKRKIEYLAYRTELLKLQEDQREILKILPKKAEASSFINSLQQQCELSGVEFGNLTPEPEVPEDLYIRMPHKMEITGTYHGISRFFKNVSEMARIVNLENFSLLPEKTASADSDPSAGRIKLKAKFVAVTYRFQDQPGGAGATP